MTRTATVMLMTACAVSAGTFSTVLDRPGPDRAVSVLTNGDGYLALGMIADYYTLPSDLQIVELDGTGDTLSVLRSGGAFSEIPGGMDLGPDGRLFVTALTTWHPDSGTATVLALDPGLDTAWCSTLDMGRLCEPAGITALAGGGCVIAGTTHDGDNLSGFAARFDGTGGLVWSRLYPTGHPCEFTGIAGSPGEIVCCGTSGERGWTGIRLLRLDLDGNAILDTTFGYGPLSRAGAILRLEDGIVITGSVQGDHEGVGDLYIARLDIDGAVMWDETFGGESWECGEDVVIAADGGFLVTGSTRSFVSATYDRSDMLLVKFDEAGSLSWWRGHGTIRSDYSWGAAACPDGGFAIAGCVSSYEDLTYYDTWIAKVDSLGEFSQQGIDPMPDRGIAISLEENPCSGSIRLTLESTCTCTADLAVFDIFGRLVAEPLDGALLHRGTTAISVPTLFDDGRPFPAGVYLVSVSAGGTRISEAVTVLGKGGGR